MRALILFLFPFTLFARDPYFVNKVCGQSLQNADQNVDSRLVMTVCLYGRGRQADVHVHSGLRSDATPRFFENSHFGAWASQHTTGDALDFRLDYPGKPKSKLTRCQLARIYKYEVEGMIRFLKKHNLYDFVGLGIYPDQITPFFHLDFRGWKARWSRIGGKYLGIESGIQFVEDWNRRCGNAERNRRSYVKVFKGHPGAFSYKN